MKYKNNKEIEITTEKLSNPELVMTYRFFLKYYNLIKKIDTEDKEYKEYVNQMNEIKDGLKLEIVSRKLKMSQYK